MFLNVPRLLRFDRDKLWYHSPFGTVVPNPAIKNETHHAPPANISPDPYGNVTEIWRHWGPDWWYVWMHCSARVLDTHALLHWQVGVGVFHYVKPIVLSH